MSEKLVQSVKNLRKNGQLLVNGKPRQAEVQEGLETEEAEQCEDCKFHYMLVYLRSWAFVLLHASRKGEDLPFFWTRDLGKLAIPFLMCHCPSIDVWCLRQTTWYKLRRWMLAISDQMWCVNVIDLAQDAAGIISAVFKNTREGQKSNSITSPEKPSKQLHRIWFQTLDTATEPCWGGGGRGSWHGDPSRAAGLSLP